jgi:hypothetical protein
MFIITFLAIILNSLSNSVSPGEYNLKKLEGDSNEYTCASLAIN